MVSRLVAIGQWLNARRTDEYFNTFFYGVRFNSTGLSEAAGRTICVADLISYSSMTLVSAINMGCVLPRHVLLVKNLGEVQEHVSEIYTCQQSKVRCLRSLEKTVAKLMRDAKALAQDCSFVVLLWIGEAVFNIVFLVGRISTTNVVLWNRFEIVCDFVYSAAILCLLCEASDSARRKHSTLKSNLTLLVMDLLSKGADRGLCYELALVHKILKETKFGLSGWGFFDVDRSLMLTVSGISITYCVIISGIK